MTERERLVELLKNDNCSSPFICDANCKYINSENCLAERMADYLLANGVCVLPYKIGTTIWTNEPFRDGVVRDGDIIAFEVMRSGASEIIVNFDPVPLTASFLIEDVGKTVFLTREDAEKALAERSKHSD